MNPHFDDIADLLGTVFQNMKTSEKSQFWKNPRTNKAMFLPAGQMLTYKHIFLDLYHLYDLLLQSLYILQVLGAGGGGGAGKRAYRVYRIHALYSDIYFTYIYP